METKYVRVPFEVELAKKITNGECDGRIMTRDDKKARIVCWDAEGRDDYILALLSSENREYPVNFMPNGRMVKDERTQSDLMLEIPEYMTFKDGDVIAYENVKDVFFIIGSKCSTTDENPHYYVKYEKGGIAFGTEDSFCRLKYSRLATEEERQGIIDELKASKDPLAKECLKKLGIEVKQECEFKPFDKVLVSDDYKDSKWSCDFFSHKNEDGLYVCIGQIWENCIPYEGNEHLLGTTENYE